MFRSILQSVKQPGTIEQMGTTRERKSSRTGQETRDRILDAALETVRVEGLVGTSARAIARTGDFNQALVFYHFGSVEDLLLAALERANDRRIGRFRDRLNAVDSLGGLVEIASDLHVNNDDPDHSALSAIVAGWSTSSDVGQRILATLRPWDDMVEAALQRSLAVSSHIRWNRTSVRFSGNGSLDSAYGMAEPSRAVAGHRTDPLRQGSRVR